MRYLSAQKSMGMRTAIILKYEYRNERWPNMNFTAVKVYYHQWGIGRGVLSQMMAIMNNHICNSIDCQEHLKYLQPQGTLDLTPNLLQSEVCAALIEQVGFDHPYIIGKIMQACDNNDGGVYMHIVQNNDKSYNTIYDIKYAFMTGTSVDRGKFVRKETWIKKEGGEYVDTDFRKLFEDTLKYWCASEYKQSKHKEE
jgi:hypothetical protein